MNIRNVKNRNIICLLFLLFLFFAPKGPDRVFADAEVVKTDTVFKVGSAQGQAGESVQIVVHVEGCVPFYACGLQVHYDKESLKLFQIQAHEDMRPKFGLSLNLPHDHSKGVLNFVNNAEGNSRFEDGPILLLTFKVLSDAQPNDYLIDLSVSNAKWVNWELQSLSGTFVPGIVRIDEGSSVTRHPVSFQGGPGATGSPPSLVDMTEGESFQLPANSFQKAGHEFSGWYDGSHVARPGIVYTMPSHSLIFTAQWEEIIPATSRSDSDKEINQTTTVQEPLLTRSSIDPSETMAPTKGGEDLILVVDPADREARDIKVEETEEGILVKGKDLSDFSFDISKPGLVKRITLNTEEREVLVREVEKDVVEIFVDRDGDGFFETSIDRLVLTRKQVPTLILAGFLTVLVTTIAVTWLLLKKRASK